MRIKFLGTAAAEGWPALFCECDACEKARELGGKNIRTRSSCLIDDKYMVDFSADTYMHKLMYNLKLSRVEHLFITHSHYDHFYPYDFEVRMNGFAYIKNKKILNVYGNEEVKARYDRAVGFMNIGGDVAYNVVKPLIGFKAGDANVIPLPANHSKGENCYIYIIEIGGKVLLYGHDSGYFKEDAWEEILKHRFDGVVLDCTFGPKYCRDGHAGLSTDVEIMERMVQAGAGDSKTKFIVNHFSHNMGLMHDEMEKEAQPYGFIVTYDGLEIEI
jgi:hypothetical protein